MQQANKTNQTYRAFAVILTNVLSTLHLEACSFLWQYSKMSLATSSSAVADEPSRCAA